MIYAQVENCIQISEVLAAPSKVDWNNDGKFDSNDEYIEVINCSDKSIDITGWYIDDMDGGSSPYIIPNIVLSSYEIVTFFKTDTKISLNNTNDVARLLDKNMIEVSKYDYSSSSYDLSFQYLEEINLWVEAKPTPDEKNLAPQAKNIIDLNEGELSVIVGRVVSNGELYDSDDCFIQDDSSSIKIIGEVKCDIFKIYKFYGVLKDFEFDVSRYLESDKVYNNLEVVVSDISDETNNMYVCSTGVISDVTDDSIRILNTDVKIMTEIFSKSDKNKEISFCGFVNKKYGLFRIYSYPNEIKILSELNNTGINILFFNIIFFVVSVFYYCNRAYKVTFI